MYVNLPPQRKAFKQKTKQWRKEVVNKLDSSTSIYNNRDTRKSVRNKIINQELYQGILNKSDMTNLINPYGIIADTIPNNITHHPIAVPKIDLLVGEESNRPFDFSVVIGDRDGIASKQEQRKEIINQKITELVDSDLDEDQLKAELDKFKIYLKYEWKDMREVRATKLLKHYWKALDMESMFLEGFKDALIHGEEIYQCSIQDNEPIIRKLNPIKVHTLRGGYSSRVEDSDIIIIEDHWSPGDILDKWGSKLTTEEMTRIENGYVSDMGAFDQADYARSFVQLPYDSEGPITDDFINIARI
jgi:hypothetical protein